MIRVQVWNVHHHTPKDALAEEAGRFVKMGVDVFLLQEVKLKRGHREVFTKLGYRSRYASPEFMIAWNPERFEYVRHRKILMSPTKYWTLNYALVVVLRDKRTGKTIKFMSYHTPAHVQAPKHVTWPKVWKVLHDGVNKWNRLARKSKVDACIFGGDDNVDEHKGWKHPQGGWGFMLDGPLEQIEAPEGTHGRRRIDDFRVRGVRPVQRFGPFEVTSDHDTWICDFVYQR